MRSYFSLNVIHRKRETMVLLAQTAGTAACVRLALCKAIQLYPGAEFGLQSLLQCGKLRPPQGLPKPQRPSNVNTSSLQTHKIFRAADSQPNVAPHGIHRHWIEPASTRLFRVAQRAHTQPNHVKRQDQQQEKRRESHTPPQPLRRDARRARQAAVPRMQRDAQRRSMPWLHAQITCRSSQRTSH